MKNSRKVVKTSVFPASKEEVFGKLQKLTLLQYIAKPYATFTPVGEHITIDKGIYTHEGNEYVPIWNHRIELKEIDDKQCLYSDIVEIDAGWKTLFVYLWAKCFYAHRQRRWIKLLKSNK